MSTACQIFKNSYQSFGYDDLIIMPNSCQNDENDNMNSVIDFSINDVNLRTRITTNICINTPIVSSPMDTVTSAEMAIQLALQGGIGILHCNQTIEDQVTQILKVKRYYNGFINDPITFGPYSTAQDIIDAHEKYGFSEFPIIDEDRKLVGLVSRKEIDLLDNPDKINVRDIMMIDLKTAPDSSSLAECTEIIKKCKISRLLIVDSEGKLAKLVCRKDIKVLRKYPLATLHHETRQLMVGAAVSTHESDKTRIHNLIEAGVDFLVIDSSNGATQFQINTLKYIKNISITILEKEIDVICGNVVTGEQARILVMAGANGIRVGMGIGSICTTQNVTGVGRGQASAIFDVAHTVWKMTMMNEINENGKIIVKPWTGRIIPIIADGGISNTGHIVKALALGADCVMLGSMLAGTDEAPGDYYYKEGVRVKKYRGMGSMEAMTQRGSKERYLSSESSGGIVTQGVSGVVTGKGGVDKYVPTLAKAIKHGFQNMGCKDMIYRDVKFEIRTSASILDGNVHHLFSYEH
jgi:IMP dehydrogenase